VINLGGLTHLFSLLRNAELLPFFFKINLGGTRWFFVIKTSFNKELVGTLNQAYPLLQYDGTVSMWLSLVARQTTPNPTTWAAPGAATWPEETIYSKVSTVVPDPYGRCRTPRYTNQTPGTGPGPLRRGPGYSQ
jgi:hypothetical protein